MEKQWSTIGMTIRSVIADVNKKKGLKNTRKFEKRIQEKNRTND